MTYPEVIPPPPSPENMMFPQQPQMPPAIAIPMNAMKTLARYYKDFHWIIGLTGQKVPRELDIVLRKIAESDNPEAMQELQNMAQGGQPNYDPYNVGPQEIPAPRIGERVLTNDIAQQAWELHYLKHWTFRDIAEYLTRDGYPVSHTTVSNYISEIDEDIEEEHNSRGRKIKQALFTVGIVTIPALAVGLAVHFLRL
jgi:hypothetical protein